MTIKATTDAYLELKTNIGLDPTNGLDKFIYYTELQTAENPVFLYDVDRAIIKLTWGKIILLKNLTGFKKFPKYSYKWGFGVLGFWG